MDHRFCFLAFFVLAYVRTSTQFSITSCVDGTKASSISLWKSGVVHKMRSVNGSSVFTFEGPSGNSGVEVAIKYSQKLRAVPLTRTYVYVEYLNESPRRLVLQPVKNEKGSDFTLLPGDSSDGQWGVGVEELDVAKGEPSITGILKKPQSISFRKLVIFTLRSNSVASASERLGSNSCSILETVVETPQSQVETTQRPMTITPGCTTPPKSVPETCSVCPECKCVCNCNCKNC